MPNLARSFLLDYSFNMRIYDVTISVNENVPIYEGDPQVNFEIASSIAEGAPANVSHVCFGVHTATHVDAPNHFIDGTRTVDELDLEKLIGKCRVVELDKDVLKINRSHVENANLENAERVLFKTRNSDFWNDLSNSFRKDFTYIAPEAAKALVDLNIKLVGIDYLSVEKFGSEDFAAHITLLEKDVVIIEGLDLREISAGDYELICLPLKLKGGTGDGAPARTVLREI